MTTIQNLLAEFDQEMQSTRKLLERVPLEDADWKPHPKSRSLGELARHVAAIPLMATRVLTTAEFEATPPGSPQQGGAPTLLSDFDERVGAARSAFQAGNDAVLGEAWTFKFRGRTMFTIPKADALRRMCFSHIIHHRGQLTVYLRLKDVALPPVYGPTADEAF